MPMEFTDNETIAKRKREQLRLDVERATDSTFITNLSAHVE